MYKKIIIFLLLIFSIICYSEKISQNSEICEYFRDKEILILILERQILN